MQGVKRQRPWRRRSSGRRARGHDERLGPFVAALAITGRRGSDGLKLATGRSPGRTAVCQARRPPANAAGVAVREVVEACMDHQVLHRHSLPGAFLSQGLPSELAELHL